MEWELVMEVETVLRGFNGERTNDRTMNDDKRTTNDERRTTNDERQTTNDERRTTNDERQTTTTKDSVSYRLALIFRSAFQMYPHSALYGFTTLHSVLIHLSLTYR